MCSLCEPKPKVFLVGGPGHVPQTIVVDASQLDAGKLKVPSRGGYEHFAREDEAETPEGVVAVYAWCGRTEMAE